MLGVKRNKVLLSPYDEDWINQYQSTKEELELILGDSILNIYHVGSTAIKNIVAKPILDVSVEIRCIKTLNITGMEIVGYEWCGEHGGPGHYLFVKRLDDDISTHHIHCYLPNHENLWATVLFCEYLNSHPEQAKLYNDLKEELAKKYPDDRNAYTEGKTVFINRIVDFAKEELQINEV